MSRSRATLTQTYAAVALAAVNDALTLQVHGAAVCTFLPIAAASPAGIVLTFEGRADPSDPWVVLSSLPTNATNATSRLAASAAIAALPTFGWSVVVAGLSEVRARVSARTGGSITLRGVLGDHLPA